jgi:hypothetical protein
MSHLSIKALLAIVAVYGVLFATLEGNGIVGWTWAALCGSAVALIIVVRSGATFVETARLVAGVVCGCFVGAGWISSCILRYYYLYDHGVGERDISCVVGTVGGVMCGVIIASIVNSRSRHSACS